MTDVVVSGWREIGACVSADPNLFFPVPDGGNAAAQADQALRICAGCLVRRQCLEYAMQNGEMEGIWGGTTPRERKRARRRLTGRPHATQPSGPAPQAA